MASKTPQDMMLEMLRDLSEEEFQRFCYKLRDSKDQPRVRNSEVEGKSRIQIIAVMVSRCSENGALDRTRRILRDIECNDQAQQLGELKLFHSHLRCR